MFDTSHPEPYRTVVNGTVGVHPLWCRRTRTMRWSALFPRSIMLLGTSA